MRKFIVLNAVAALAVSSWRKNGKSCDRSKEERARSLAWKRRRRHSVNAASTPWSPRQEWWVREQQCLAKQKKHVVVLRNHYIFAFCAVRKRTHILELFQHNFSHSNAFLLSLFTLVAHAWPTVPKAHATPTNPHMLVQRSSRCAQGIHYEYVHLHVVLSSYGSGIAFCRIFATLLKIV